MNTFDHLRQELAAGKTSCEKIVRSYLGAIDKGKALNAFLSVFREKAQLQAAEIDKKIQTGTAAPLAGMVVSVKDVICVKDERVTCGSKILENFVSLYDATVIARLKAADAVIIGKCNMDEFAMGSSTENSAFGRVRLPQDESRIPGGSSGGSAVAVKAGMSTTSLGSDTGGSIRQPAALTGVVGLKPTYGRVSRYGLVAFASSLDCIGPFGLCVKDVARVLKVIAGHDVNDSTSALVPVPDYVVSLNKDVKRLRVGLPKEYYGDALNAEIREALDRKVDILRKNGATIQEVSLPSTDYCIATYYILATAEASSNLARYDGARYGYRATDTPDLSEMYVESRTRGFGSEVKRRIMLGTYVLSAGYYDAYYRKGQKVRRIIQDDFSNAFQKVDVLITPTSPTTAFKAGEKAEDPLQMYLSDIYTTSANLAGIPGISIPCGSDSHGLPIGMQVLGKQFDEATVLKVADFLESTA
ncbi:MAG: Asp-tRNA(Asn)/Glu-tRNA(Gln) amidotransferase subunit GatA [Ignavibacteriales bacterium]|nr:Asp-tRNA(Asn)/Glu-tRNA(Gln) amidotransferase subunit GatA [Ignavibacteriales bacterium]